jgi:hypothetical protein
MIAGLISCQKSSAPSAAIDQSVRCDGIAVPVLAEPADSFDTNTRCQLAARGIDLLRQAPEDSGVLPGDTAFLSNILIVPLTEIKEGSPPWPTWHVGLELRGRPYDAEVIIDRNNGTGAVYRFHKAMR